MREKIATENPKKILFINLEGQISGAEKSLLLTIKHLPSGFQPEAACPKAGELAGQLREMGVRVYFLPETPRKCSCMALWLGYYWLVNMKILWIMLPNKPKLIHANTTKAVLAALLGVVLLRVRLLWHVRDAGCPGWVLRICSASSSQIISVSQALRSQLLAGGVRADKIEVVGNSVGLTLENRRVCRHTESLFTFANIGQWVPWKKQMLFIDAAELYLAKGFQATFLIVGSDVFGRDAEYVQLIERRVAKSRYSGSFEIMPWQKDLKRLWQDIDCLVHTADKEPFGRVVIEAMEQEIPVIAADAFGPSEILEDCITGFLFEPEDVHELCCCMEIVSQNPGQIKDIVSSGYQYVCQNHDIQTTIKQIQAIYSKLLAA